MILNELTLSQFRSYGKTMFSFSPGVTLLTGDNTTGKTNVLEAIYLLATGKSFRADTDREVIRWGKEVSVVSCTLLDGNDSTKLQIMITTGEVGGARAPLKKYLVNGVTRRMIDFVGNVRAVLFWPEHLELVTDSPSIRRKYLDSVLIQVDREYRRNLMSYERGLRQRNRLLDLINDGKAHHHQLLFWNQLLIKSGNYITDVRANFIDFVNSYNQQSTAYQLIYDKSVISEARLVQYTAEEIAAKATLVGPHRDDFTFVKEISNKNISDKKDKNFSLITSHLSLSSYGSRGEQRLAVLWLKLAEVSYIEKQTGERPLLLLDDIFSELDEGHRELVFDIIGKQQTIITTAEEEVTLMLKRKNKTMAIISL
jgi:DNA replication and repair protein RecF